VSFVTEADSKTIPDSIFKDADLLGLEGKSI